MGGSAMPELDEHTFDEANFPDVFPQDYSLEAKLHLIDSVADVMRSLNLFTASSDFTLLKHHISEDVYRYNTELKRRNDEETHAVLKLELRGDNGSGSIRIRRVNNSQWRRIEEIANENVDEPVSDEELKMMIYG
jgi:hypothetical protein